MTSTHNLTKRIDAIESKVPRSTNQVEGISLVGVSPDGKKSDPVLIWKNPNYKPELPDGDNHSA